MFVTITIPQSQTKPGTKRYIRLQSEYEYEADVWLTVEEARGLVLELDAAIRAADIVERRDKKVGS